MPQVAVVAASWVASAVLSATTSAGLAAAAGNAVLALGFAQGVGAGLAAWATVGALAGGLSKPKLQGSASGASQVDWKADPNGGIPYVIGRTGTAGNIVAIATTGAKGKFINFVTVHSLGPVEAFETFYADKEPVSFTTPGRNGEEAAGRFLNRMWRKQVLGTTGQSAMAWTATGSKDTPADHGGNVTGFWTSAHTLTGLAGSLIAMATDANVFTTGAPKPLDVLRGPAVYDPRLDSTYPGGAGAQRIDDESTWSFTGRDNPYLQALAFAIGRVRVGVVVIGLGLPAAAIDIPAFVDGANVAEANGWTIGGVISSADSKWDVFRAMLIAGGGIPAPGGDKLSCIVNAPRTSLDTLTGSEVVGPWSVQAAQPKRNRPNQIIPGYRSEDHGWEIVPAAAVKVEDYVTADGRLRSRGVDYDLVQDAGQAAQLAAYDMVNAREFGPITLPCKPKWTGYRPGDCITLDEEEFGLAGQKAVILRRSTDWATGVVTLTLRSETDGKHDFALGRTPNPPPIPGLTSHDPAVVVAPAADIWTAAGGVLEKDGATVPCIIVTGECDDPNAASIIFETRLAGDEEWTTQAERPANTTRVEITSVAPSTEYEVAVSYRTVRDVIGARLVLTGVTTGSLIAESSLTVETIGGETTEDVYNSLLGVIAQGSKLLVDLRAAEQRAAALARTTAALQIDRARADRELKRTFGFSRDGLPVGGFTRHLELVSDSLVYDRQLMGVRAGDNSAFFLSDTTLKFEGGDTVAERFELLYAADDTAMAAVSTEQSARISADTAEASARTTLAATVSTNYSTLNSAIVSETSARTTADTTIASSVTTLTSTVSSNLTTVNSSITSEASTRASADSTLTSSISSLSSTVTGNYSTLNSAITSESSTRASADSTFSSSLSGLSSTVSGNFSTLSASIASESSTRASADSANASSISTVSTTVSGHTSSITTLQSSVSGLDAQYVLSVSSSGGGQVRVAGAKLAASGTVSSIVFFADEIGFTNGSSDFYPFSISGGVVKMTNVEVDTLKANTIVTGHLTSNSITTDKIDTDAHAQAVATGGDYGGGVGGGGGGALVASVTISCTGGRVLVTGYYTGRLTAGPGEIEPTGTLKRDGSDMLNARGYAKSGYSYSLPFMIVDDPGSGSHTYDIYDTVGGGATIALFGYALSAMELKKTT